MEHIPHSKPWITSDDISKIGEVLASSMIGQGAVVRQLENRLAEHFGVAEGVAVGSGSAAIMLALHDLGIGVGDEIILPTYVCRSVPETVLSVGATPIFCDCGTDWVITASNALRVLSARTRAIVVPHLYGIFANIDEFRSLGVPIIEDCAQAVEAKGKRVAQGDVTVLSFHPTKCITAGEGGMALSSNARTLACMRAYRDGRDKGNYCARLFSPLSDLAATLVLSQLDRYVLGLARRKEIAENYLFAVKTTYSSVINPAALACSMFFRFPLCLPGGLEACQEDFAGSGISVRPGVDELLHRKMGLSDTAFPNVVKLFKMTVSLPIYPALTRADELRCIKALSSVLLKIRQCDSVSISKSVKILIR